MIEDVNARLVKDAKADPQPAPVCPTCGNSGKVQVGVLGDGDENFGPCPTCKPGGGQ